MRHGSHGDLGERLTGRGPESGLTAAGRTQVEQLAAELADGPVAAVYASPRVRTCQTAGAIALRHGLPVVTSDALDEIDFGDWTGRTFADLDGLPHWDRWNSRRSEARCPGGESMAETAERAAAFVDEVATRHDGRSVVLVTHCDIIRALLCREHGKSLDDILSFEAEPASVTRLHVAAAQRAAA